MASILHFLNCINCLFVGKCFVDIAEEMKEVYAVYCRNHDDAISLVEKVCQHKLELELNDMIG